MQKTFAIAWAVVSVFALQLAASHAEKPGPQQPSEKSAPPPGDKGAPPMPKAGAETKALSPLAGTLSGEGKLEPGAMGPGSPATTSKAKHNCKWILNELWLACDVTDTAAAKPPMTWMGHMILGWDFEAKSYRAVGVDNMGATFELNAKLDGKKFIMESAHEVMMMGTPVKYRFTFDMSDPKGIKFTDERSVKGSPFQLAETITFKKSGG